MNDATTAHEDIRTRLSRLRDRQARAFLRDGEPTVAMRKDRLSRAISLLRGHASDFVDALKADYGVRPAELTVATELFQSLQALRHARSRVRRWMRTERRGAPVPFRLIGVRASVYRQPKGVVGLISPWNFPINLTFTPLAGILAAGNRCVVKPSEFTPETAALIERLVARYFSEEELAVVTGGPEVGRALADAALDHLLFTGSTAVGRRVMAAAAETLTPVTLELGGKSPVIIGTGADIDKAAARTATGKMMNAGQICIAPDYVFVPADEVASFTERVQSWVATMYPDLRNNGDYASIINERHARRLMEYVSDARERGVEVVEVNPAHERFESERDRRLPLYLIIDPPPEARVMQEEIFGPILPIVPYRRFDDVIARINRGSRPLAVYYFGSSRSESDSLVKRTTAGGMCINDVIVHVALEELPLGGVGASGMGRYHGFDGFREFSHEKAIYRQGLISTASFVRPPHDRRTRRLLKALTGTSL
jgi:coniferyl-aldehyde dehydrogenase